MKEARHRAVALLATSGRKMRARAIAEAIGEDMSTPARVETTWGRLKTRPHDIVAPPTGRTP